MEFPCITLHTKGGDSIRWREGYAGVTNAELETFPQQSRDAVASLEAEIEKRQLRIPSRHPDGNDGCHEKLRKAADKLKIMERLDDRASKHVNTAVEVLTRSQTIRAFKVYQDFLYDVLRHSSPGLVLLCAIGLGKQRIANMTTEDRVSLLNHVKEKKDFLSSSTLEALAKDHEIPCLDNPQVAHILERNRKRKRDESQQAGKSSQARSQDMQAGRQIQYMFSKAPRSLIRNLGSPLSDAVQASNQWKMEDSLGETTTVCMAALVAEGPNEDVSITFWAGRSEGRQMIDYFKMQPTWQASPSHLSLQPHIQREQDVPYTV